MSSTNAPTLPLTVWDSRNIVDPGTWLGAAILAVIFFVAAYLTGRAVRMAIHRYLDRAAQAGVDPTGVRFLGKLASGGVYIFAFLCYSHVIPPLQHLGTAWLTSMGVLSVVVGLAAQTTLGNLISGISLVLYRPFRLGDQLQITGPKGMETGTVESINLGTTVLVTADNRRLVIPNNTMASQIIVNLSATRKGGPCNVVVTIVADADAALARKILGEIGKAQPKISAIDGCNVTAITGAGTEITLSAWCGNGDDAALVRSDILEAAKKQFAAAGINFAIPAWTPK